MAKKTKEENDLITETTVEETLPTVIEKIIEVEKIVKQAPSAYDLYQSCEKDNAFNLFINDFFKYYLMMDFKQCNAILLTDNCIKYLSSEFNNLLSVYLNVYQLSNGKFNNVMRADKLKNITMDLRNTLPVSLFVKQNITKAFEKDNKTWFIGNAYKLYAITNIKETK